MHLRKKVEKDRLSGPRSSGVFTQILLIVIVVCTILAPGFVLSKNLPSLRIEDLLILIAAIMLLAKNTKKSNKLLFGKNIRPITIPYILLTVWILLITILEALPSLNGTKLLSAFLSLFSTTKALLLAVVLIALIKDDKTIIIVFYTIMICLLIELFIMYAQANDLFNVHEWLTPLYRRDKRFSSAESRIGGSLGNPNVTAVAIASMVALIMAKLTIEKSKVAKAIEITCITLSLYCVVAFTGSRTGMMVCILAMGMPYVIIIFLKKHHKKALILVVGIVAMQVVLPSVLLDTKWSNRYDSFLNEDGIEQTLEDQSFTARVDNWKNILGLLGYDVLGGRGALSRDNWIVTDNGYISIIVNGGLVALLFYLWSLFAPVKIMLIHLFKKSNVNNKNVEMLLGGLSCITILIVSNITVPVFTHARLNAIFMVVIALSLSSIRLSKKNKW